MAGIKRGGPVDYQQNEIRNAVVQNLSGAPGSPKAGQVYYDTTLNEFGYYNGTSWSYSVATPDATTGSKGIVQLAGDLAGTAASPTVVGLHLSADTAINHKLTSVTDGTNPQDAATINNLTTKLQGKAWKDPVAATSAAALPGYVQSGAGATGTLTASANGALTVDGYAVQTNDRLWIMPPGAINLDGSAGGGAAAAKDAGLYTVSNPGGAGAKYVLIRAADAAIAAQLQDATALSMQGTKNGTGEFTVTNAPGFVVDTTAITIALTNIGSIIGDGIYTQRSGNQLVIVPASATPTTPANGSVSAVELGTARVAKFALAGDGATTVFTCTHNWGTYAVIGHGQVQSGGNPASPIELDWAPSSPNAVQITFPAAPAAAQVYYFTLIG